MVLTPGENILREYWRQFAPQSQYRVYMERFCFISTSCNYYVRETVL